MVPLESLAVAASGTAAPDAKFWFAVGLVSETVGAGLVVPTVKLTAVEVVLAPPLSVAVAVAECVPLARPVALKLYGELVSVFTTLPSTRNTTLAMVPFESLAVAASGTAAPDAKLWFAVGLVSETVGAGLPPPPTVNVTVLEVVLAPPLSVAVAVAVCVPVARPVALKL
jgi:hypothetical protein